MVNSNTNIKGHSWWLTGPVTSYGDTFTEKELITLFRTSLMGLELERPFKSSSAAEATLRKKLHSLIRLNHLNIEVENG